MRPPLECLIDDNLAALQVFLENDGWPDALADAMANDRTQMTFDRLYLTRAGNPCSLLVDCCINWATTPQGRAFWRQRNNNGARVAISNMKNTPRFKELRTQVSAYVAPSSGT